jgi:hypothetical protein
MGDALAFDWMPYSVESVKVGDRPRRKGLLTKWLSIYGMPAIDGLGKIGCDVLGVLYARVSIGRWLGSE